MFKVPIKKKKKMYKKDMCAITCRLGSLQDSVIWEKDKYTERSYQMCHIMQISPNDVFQEKYCLLKLSQILLTGQ